MKRCPQCGRDYLDDTLSFCLDDGTGLLDGPTSFEGPATEILTSGSTSGETPTRLLDSSAPRASSTGSFGKESSIAVLPFSNISADPENDYFCDGLAEELLSALNKIQGLRVAARSSSFAFKGTNKNVTEIGESLRVATILEGSVRKAGNRLRINVRLESVRDGSQIWEERFDREMDDIFEVQDEIALSVAEALKVELLGKEKEAVLKRYTNNTRAYSAYLKGRFFLAKRTPDSLRRAIECYEEAIGIDPGYAIAYSGLADCHIYLGYYELIPPDEALEKAGGFAQRSFELDDSIAESNASMAAWLTFNWRFEDSDTYCDRAIAIDPANALAFHYKGSNLMCLGRFREALPAQMKTLELEPFNNLYNANVGIIRLGQRRYEEAAEQLAKTITLAPDHYYAYRMLGLAYSILERDDDAREMLLKAVEISRGAPDALAELGRFYAATGQEEEAREILSRLEEFSKTHYLSPLNPAMVYAGLGEKEKVLELLEAAADERAFRLPFVIRHPWVYRYRSDNRIKELAEKIGLVMGELPGAPSS